MNLSQVRPRRLGPLLFALLIGGWLAGFGLLLLRLHSQTLDDGLNTANTHARNFEEHLTQILQVIELVAINLDPATTSKANAGDLGAPAGAALRTAPYIRSLSLLDADGRVIASSAPQNIGLRVNLVDFFPDTDPSVEALRIGAPRHGRDLSENPPDATRTPLLPADVSLLPVLRRLPGEPLRWVLAAINPDYVINQFSQLLDPVRGHAQLLRYDGMLLASSSLTDVPGARGLAGEVTHRLSLREAGHFEQTLPDGRAVLSAYRASSRFPIAIAAHLDREQALAGWRAEAQQMAVIFLPAVVAFLIAGILALRRQFRVAAQQAELYRQTRLAASVFAASSDAIILTHPTGEIISCNPAFLRITGYEITEVLGKNPRMLSSGHQDREFYINMWQTILRDDEWQGEIVNRRKDGDLHTGLLSINAVRDEAGALQHYVGVTHDITERKRAQAAELEAELKLQQQLLEKKLLQEQAVRDVLSGLNNRRYLDETLPREIARAKREGYPLSLIMLDIDHFKKINDTYGHPGGDEVIRALGRIISADVREGDLAARYGGEEFVVALPRMDLDAATARAEKWRVSAMARSVRHGELDIGFTFSAGVASYPKHGADMDNLLLCADFALYEAKKNGRNRVARHEAAEQEYDGSTADFP